MEQPAVEPSAPLPPPEPSTSVPLESQEQEPRPVPPPLQPQQPPQAVDLRDSYVSLTVSPGFEAALEHLKRERQIAAFMSQFFAEYAQLEQETAKKLQALADGATARFERSFVQKAWLGIKTGQSNEVLQEIGTTQTAWQSVRESMMLMSSAHMQMGQQVQESVAASLRNYLAESEEAAAKVELWGTRLSEAMANYVRRAEEAKNAYHSRARAARVAAKILEEAEKQSQIGGITRGIILTTSRMDKMKEAVEKSRDDEVQSAQEYRSALELVAKKKNELYSIRLPRVMAEIQRLVEERTSRIHVELSKFVAAGKEIFPLLHEAFAVAQAAVEGVSPLIDTRVFVAQAMSNDSIPEVLEFVPFDAQSSQLLASMDRIGAAFVVSGAPSAAAAVAAEDSFVLTALKDAARTQELLAQLVEQDPVSASGVRFLRSVQEFRKAEGFEMAVEIYHTFLGEDSVELLAVTPERRAPIVSRIKDDDYADKSLFDEACKAVVAALEAAPLVRELLKPSVPQRQGSRSSPPPHSPSSQPKPTLSISPGNSNNALPAAAPLSSQPPAAKPPPPAAPAAAAAAALPPPQLVLRDELDLGEEDFLGGSDDELLNRNESIDDIIVGD